MSGHALTANRAQDREVRPPKTDVLPLCISANTHCWNGALNHEVNTTFHCHITWNASQTALKRVKTPLHKANKSSAVAEMGHRGHNRHGPKTGGGSVPFWGGRAGSPSNTMSLGSRSTCIPSGILIHPGVWPQRTWAKNCGSPFVWGSCPHLAHCGLDEAHLHAKCRLDPSSRLATVDMGQKMGVPPLFGEGELGPHLTQSRLGRGLPPYQVAS